MSKANLKQNFAVFGDHIYQDFAFSFSARNYQETKTFFEKIKQYKQEYFIIICVKYEFYTYLFDTNFTSKKPYIYALCFKKRSIFKLNLNPFMRYYPTLTQKLDKKAYCKAFKKVLKSIKKGQSYQINLTQKLKLRTKIPSFELFKLLTKEQNAEYKAFLQSEFGEILCFSPELFFKIKDQKILTEPMKGTIKRGENEILDKQNKHFLQNDHKNLSENVMIVDLLRNDLSKIADEVKVDKLFAIKTYKSLHQMISQISATLKAETTLFEVFEALFPCGSITGAPKLETMKLINKLERRKRGVYCGAIGLVHKDESVFNVAIRTLERKSLKSDFSFGVGSGVVFDSKAGDEFKELKLKSSFLKPLKQDFCLFETMLFKYGKILFFKEHLKRLFHSALALNFKHKKLLGEFKGILEKQRAYQDFTKLSFESFNELLFSKENDFFDESFVKSELKEAGLRLKLFKNGDFEFEFFKIKPSQSKLLYLSKDTFIKDDLSFHKSSLRDRFSNSASKCEANLCYDEAFCDEKERLLEGSRTNLVLSLNGKLYTPSLKFGLLDGIYRQVLLQTQHIKEKTLFKPELFKADELWAINSLRGAVKLNLKVFDE
ncbi:MULTISPECIES: bifunctional anthranilate synthase component I family protein/class IV aminotransferase [unclassified Campylobacter]|uniref:chorismate-binding protein n=1 Tax=unclassified Campylobacter TaxID=2593542 RepID=UPI00192EB87F|nr:MULTISPECIES: bifunctional anthranilate synthase component I family protein/class IV aminotransferase [unclassified Campylobacter]